MVQAESGLLSLKVETGFRDEDGLWYRRRFAGAALVSNAGLFLYFLLAREVRSVLV